MLVGACWPHESELLSFLALLWALGGIALVLDFAWKYLQSVLLLEGYLCPPPGYPPNGAALFYATSSSSWQHD